MKIEDIPPLLLPGEKIEHIVIFGSKEIIEKKVKELKALGYKEDKGNENNTLE